MTMGRTRTSGQGNRLQLSIPSRLSAIERVCGLVRGLLEQQHLERLRFEVEIVVRECLNNAVIHGNGGHPERRVSFAMRVGRRRICLQVADPGPGFDWRRACRRPWPGATQPTGRGLLLISTHARHVRFNSTGNRVTLWIDITREER